MSKEGYHHGDLRAAILDTAEELIADCPIEMVSMRELARKAGVSPGAPYHHFQDRSGLILALCQRGFSRLRATLSGNGKTSGMNGLIEGYLDFATKNPALYQLMFSPEATMGDHAEALHPYARPVSELLDAELTPGSRKLPEGEADQVAAAIWCFMHGVATLGMASPLRARLGETSMRSFATKTVRQLLDHCD